MERYFVGCYWGDRKEDPEGCSMRMVDCLNSLARCDPVFGEVYAVPNRKLPYRITIDLATIETIVESGRNREDFRPYKVIEKLGYSGSFVSDFRKPDEKWTLRFLCGAYPNTPGLLNSCVLRLPNVGEARERLLKLESMRCMITTLIEAWDPDWAVAQSSELRDFMSEEAGIPGKALVGWMVYFSQRVGKVPSDLHVYSKVELSGRGTLLILSGDPFSSTCPDHLETAKAILPSLQNAGLIPA